MRDTRTRGLIVAATVATSVIALSSGCNKQAPEPDRLTGSLAANTQPAPAEPKPLQHRMVNTGNSAAALIERIGVEPGAFSDDDMAPEAVVLERAGVLSVRRVGEESFDEAKADEAIRLYAGDQLQTGEGAHAVLMLSDHSRVELAELSTVAVGERESDADPASSIAVMVGVARFEISARAEGEGPFLVFAPNGVINALGTAFVVGVSVTGSVRVGVEEGSVEVVGEQDMTQPARLEPNDAVTLGATGALSPVAKLETSWDAWVLEQELEADLGVVAELQIAQAQDAESKLEAGFKQLDTQVDQAQTLAATEALEQSANVATYEADAAARAESIEKAFLLSLRLQQLRFAMLAHAHVAQQLRLRQPDKLADVKTDELSARATLFNKKYQVAHRAHIRPLRAAYYRHHPRGRRHARAMGVKVPAFFARTRVPELEQLPTTTGATRLYSPRRPSKVDKQRRATQEGPPRDWHANLKHETEAAPGKSRDTTGKPFFVMTPEARAALMLATKPARRAAPVLGKHAPTSRAQAVLAWAERTHGGHPDRHAHDEGPHRSVRGRQNQPATAPTAQAQLDDPAAQRQPAVNPAGHVLPAQAQAHGNRVGKVAAPRPAPAERPTAKDHRKGHQGKGNKGDGHGKGSRKH